MKARHDVALLYLVRVCLGPDIVLSGCVIGGIHLRIRAFQRFGVIRSVTVPDGVRAPALQDLQRLGHHIHVCWDRHAPPVFCFVHYFSPILPRPKGPYLWRPLARLYHLALQKLR